LRPSVKVNRVISSVQASWDKIEHEFQKKTTPS
jgi:hypothetical protein